MGNQKERELLKQSMQNAALCAVNRDFIDPLTLYGFPVELSGGLAAFSFIYDFRPDGYKIVRTSDITEVFSEEAEHFLERIVRAENPEFTPEPPGFALESMAALCTDLQEKKKIVTVECEGSEETIFLIGQICRVTNKEISMRTFDGMGVWDTEKAAVPLGDITCISVGNAYVEILSKYLTEKK
ncbi:MAG TPA: hypothetical protein IAC74_06795 [Candidatus Aphodoplasma excrementigallinarum]|uniref:Uncharacterized protein n=1 Tax=Candidatus Aphodoplasma excrementigallinarum TaxID=2840673 RepID=A0A9D1T0P3_9FIRM|nr:hypothetical protein [Candidatus Aphodoplasma excrementigallinarum]